MPTPSTNTLPRRPREHGHREVRIGSFTRKDEIGKGSFATVYSATHTVSEPLICNVYALKQRPSLMIAGLGRSRNTRRHQNG